MSVPRAKPRSNKPDERVFTAVKRTNYLNLAITIRCLKTVFGFTDEQIADYMDSHIVLMEEVGLTNTVGGVIQDTKALTGIDVKKILDESWDRTHRR